MFLFSFNKDHPDVAISQLNGTILMEGDENIILLCLADGEPSNYTFGNWIQYAPDGATKIKEHSAEKYGNGIVSLTFPNSSYMDSGIFVCNVSNGISDKKGLLVAITNATQVVKGEIFLYIGIKNVSYVWRKLNFSPTVEYWKS